MQVITPNGVEEVFRFPGTSAIKLALKILMHPTYTIIITECDDWYSNLKLDVDHESKVIRISEAE